MKITTIKKKYLRKIALFLAINVLTNTLFIPGAYALTGGPHSPEFSSFEPVATTDMVNLSSGDFNYNLPALQIPGPEGGGYALSLSYHSGASSEEEASWVGFGWTLNPGSINRNMRGFPDDYKNISVTRYNKTRPSWSASITNSIGLELFAQKTAKGKAASADVAGGGGGGLGISASTSVRFNNYQGFSRHYGFGLNAAGLANINMDINAQGPTFSAGINIPKILSKLAKKNDVASPSKRLERDITLKNKVKATIYLKSKMNFKQILNQNFGSTYGIASFSEETRATSMASYKASSFGWTTGITVDPAPAPVGINVGMSGNFNLQNSNDGEGYKAYGFMHNQAGIGGNMSDYFVERNAPYNKRDLFLGVPFNNADHFSVVGEGLGGDFRFFPKNTGHFFPNQITNKTPLNQMGFDFQIGDAIGFGASFGLGVQTSKVDTWTGLDNTNAGNTGAYAFDANQTGVMRFSNDMAGTIEYGNSAKPNVSLPGAIGKPNIDEKNIFLNYNEDKVSNSSFIDLHTYEDITTNSKPFFNRSLILDESYFVNNNGNDNTKAIVEASIRNSDGINYVYGQPVFNRNDLNMQFNINPPRSSSSSPPEDLKDPYNYLAYRSTSINNLYDVTNNSSGEQHIGEVRKVPYASNYLLTQLTTADYVDVNQNGPDESDFGGWTSFSYHQKKWKDGTTETPWYHWRSPYNGLLFDRNEISNPQDDMSSVSMGEKELFYLKTIETKTHIAFFVTNETSIGRFSNVDIINKIFGNGFNNSILQNKILALLTGSNTSRNDGLDAAALGLEDPASQINSQPGTHKLEYLEKIVLIAKSRPDKPIKVVNFSYDYSLVQKLPNNINSGGKLTLKKVWFDYEGVYNARISPYEFNYEYKSRAAFAPEIQKEYSELLGVDGSYTGDKYSKISQNPDYSPYWLDPWGNIQRYGKERRKFMIPWVYQGEQIIKPTTGFLPGWRRDASTVKEVDFDPAAWHLKQIKLPSGGEILVEYEEKDYEYVQDRAPMVMASLLAVNDEFSGNGYNNNPRYQFNLADLGINVSTDKGKAEAQELIFKMRELYLGKDDKGKEIGKGEKIYFKFLYKLAGGFIPTFSGAASFLNPQPAIDYQSEYISGYARVDKINPITNTSGEITGIDVVLRGDNNDDSGRSEVPRQACYDFYSTQRMGMWLPKSQGFIGFFDAAINSSLDDLISSDPIKNLAPRLQIIPPMMGIMQGAFLPDFANYNIPLKSDVGTSINKDLSFLRIPMTHAKKGGGVRVKRLMTYDAGIETGDAALYGQEFNYQDFKQQADGTLKVISSGVATNEPSGAKEESSLVTALPREGQSWYSRITAGIDKEQTEGPLGESLLPGASVIHSRVVVQQIHKGITGNGFTVQEYYTTKDFPFDKVYSIGANDNNDLETGLQRSIDFTPVSKSGFPIKIPAGLFNFEYNQQKAVQGYRFIINNMNGQLKRSASYFGIYDLSANDKTDDIENKLKQYKRISEQKYEYYQPGEQVKMLKPDGTYYMDLPGKEMDVAMEMRSIREKNIDVQLEIEVVIGLIAPVPPIYFPISISVNYADKGMSTHVTSKILRYPVILKKTTSFQDGITSVTENLAFNPQTGSAVLTKTSDGFDKTISNDEGVHDGSLYSLTLPASWYYPEMGPILMKGKVNNDHTNELSASAGSVISYGKDGNPLRDVNNWTNAPIKDIISTSIQTFENNWFTNNSTSLTVLGNEYGYANSNPTITSLNKIWRPASSYAYRSDVVPTNGGGNDVRNGGIIADKMDMFDFSLNKNTNKWILSNRVTAYSPNGNAIEEKNVLNIYSAVKFGYANKSMPVMVASNASYGTIGSEDFENYQGSTSGGHSGSQALNLLASTGSTTPGTAPIFNGLTADKHLADKGALIKIWVQSDSDAKLDAVINLVKTPLIKIAQSGSWVLYGAEIPASQFTNGSNFDVSINNNNNSNVLIDDVRFQPKDAQSTTYVYDTQTLRLLTQFDDQHFGMYYQYNDEGKLIRKLVETERGLKTIQETQYNLKKTARP